MYQSMLLLLATSLLGVAHQEAPEPPSPKAPVEDQLSNSSHSVRIGGADVNYTATAGRLVLRHEDDKPKAHMFFVAYTRDGQTDLASRPITFAYNGGPGSATIWLHMGVLGPKRVDMGSEGFQPAPPYRLVDNEHSLLDVTDIVAIDAISTGFSRAAEGEDPKQFHGVRQDIEAFSEFIRLYITKFGRWSSPKYLLGESYGTVRSAGVGAHLQSRHGIELNGIVLVSSVIDFSTLRGGAANDMQFPGFLPTYTVTAWYHKKLPADLQADFDKAVREARDFAYGEYLVALNKGNRLTTQEWDDMARKVARYTGLSPEFIQQANLRISPARFRKELLREQRLVVGASTAASPRPIATPRASGRNSIRRTPRSREPIPLFSTTMCGASSGGRAPTSTSRAATSGRGTTASSRTAISTCWKSCAKRWRAILICACSSPTAITTWQRLSPPPSGPSTTWATSRAIANG